MFTTSLSNRDILHRILRIKIGNKLKRQHLDQRADNSLRPPIGLQCRKKSCTGGGQKADPEIECCTR